MLSPCELLRSFSYIIIFKHRIFLATVFVAMLFRNRAIRLVKKCSYHFLIDDDFCVFHCDAVCCGRRLPTSVAAPIVKVYLVYILLRKLSCLQTVSRRTTGYSSGTFRAVNFSPSPHVTVNYCPSLQYFFPFFFFFFFFFFLFFFFFFFSVYPVNGK